ncbi:endonuclease domain-containing protein [Aestuariivirga sp. YIM B02566]|uniref:Endonuclease domain-containing protein n=1 Tax=Taklimakanibacter albus TaxID=2800327 RepID=A0ACC5R5T4_9HYPH|nr:endonuclease domain-containing protein [Aestuariivirga sp. YIM B02566]MBK1868010.1 endonuclease domain-containing protein [Aestuariivirga sp. YIM B02566]
MGITQSKRLDQARRLRRVQTPAEARLWSGLRDRRLQNHKFTRQYPIGPYTVDFLCREARLVVEVDGVTHSTDEEIAYDDRRSAYLELQGYRILRILNDDIYRRFDDVMDMILLALEGTVSHAQ